MDTNGQTANDAETEKGPSFTELVLQLGQPLPPLWVRWRLMQRPRDGQNRGLAVAYISMTDVEDYLDEVMGPARWRCTYPLIGQFVVCRIELQDDEGKWIGKEDGAGDNVDRDAQNATDDDLDKDTKAVLSDAFKRAARRWGIGRFLNRLEKPWVDCEARGKSWVIASHEFSRLAELAGAPPGMFNGPPPAPQPAPQPAHPTYAHPAPAQTQQQAPAYNGPPPGNHQQQAPARGQGGQQGGRQGGQVFTIPGGRSKGQPLSEATEQDILFWRDKKAQGDDPRYAQSNQAWIRAADAELARRNGGGGGQAPTQRPDSSRSREGRPPPNRGGYQGPPQHDDIPFGAPAGRANDQGPPDDYPF
jgi:hypothetical protein